MLQPKTQALKDISAATFMQEVIEPSYEKPVVIDFWAPWCGPCKQLTPILEKFAASYKDEALFFKVNIDQNEHLAAQLGIKSVPTVLVFLEGQPIDGFAGALPEPQIKTFLEKHLAKNNNVSPLEEVLKHAEEAYKNQNAEMAIHLLMQVLAYEPHSPKALFLMISLFIQQGQLTEALDLLGHFQDEGLSSAYYKQARALVNLHQEALTYLNQEKEAEEHLKNKKHFCEAHEILAMCSLAKGAIDQAIEHLLSSIKQDRKFKDEAHRLLLLRLFEAWGNDDPKTLAARKKLSIILFS
jgi:putative thioredoxin